MSDPIDPPSATELEQEELDHPMRVIIIINSPDVPDADMDERLLDNIQSFDAMNAFFDSFDEAIAIPNDGHIKYEVGSDGLVVIVVDSRDLKLKALGWIDDYLAKLTSTAASTNDEGDEDTEPSKKQKK
ncbi:hypothetical protein QCA50_009903 [Cerrena zonata]|uniref:DUF1892-domain-containing protein n=2 Tax=Dikarya TaxID=451864 RepID=A0A1E4RLP0_9ASCO|nr:DUF1892-domain-containing protein [Hyphopichia burtonii NRRL Y-1933]ODV68194.1 DUF1892-domain-containing protein [Hyphopichia burtonii NRRL Y-1933]